VDFTIIQLTTTPPRGVIKFFQAGLLTRSLTSPGPSRNGEPPSGYARIVSAHSGGSVRDSHPVPYSPHWGTWKNYHIQFCLSLYW